MTEKGNISPWLTPFHSTVLGGLRGQMNQYADGDSTILTPKHLPKKTVTSQPEGIVSGSSPVCVPVEIDGITYDPVKDPYALGDIITVTPFGVTGSDTINYLWLLNGSLVPAGEVSEDGVFTHTLVDADVVNKDVGGLGETFIFLIVGNCCGLALTSTLGSINVQGTP